MHVATCHKKNAEKQFTQAPSLTFTEGEGKDVLKPKSCNRVEESSHSSFLISMRVSRSTHVSAGDAICTRRLCKNGAHESRMQ